MGDKKDRTMTVRSVLLELLRDPEVQNTFRGFWQQVQRQEQPPVADDVQVSEEKTENTMVAAQEDNDSKDKQVAKLQRKLADAQKNYQQLEMEKKTAENNIKSLNSQLQKVQQDLSAERQKRSELQSKLAQAEERETSLANDMQGLQQKLQFEKQEARALSEEKQTLQGNLEEAQSQYQNEHRCRQQAESARDNALRQNRELSQQLGVEQQKNRNLTRDKQDLQAQKQNLQQQLQERFAKEWQVYQQYLACPEEGKRSVNTVLHGARTFAAFICNGAQPRVLEFVWDAIRDAHKRGDHESEQAMRAVFHCCLNLVNYARNDDDKYELLTTEIGDEQDDTTQNYTSSSRAQGRVKEVLIHGYRNGYNQKVERKSLVVLG